VRNVQQITVPDTSRRYQIVSRQSLDDAEAPQRDGPSFRGNLKIKDIDKFWAPSKYLIIVERKSRLTRNKPGRRQRGRAFCCFPATSGAGCDPLLWCRFPPTPLACR